MKKVFQTTIDKGKGNCMQAAFASLFELQLEEVPNFIELDDWNVKMRRFINAQGYCYLGTMYNRNDKYIKSAEQLKDIKNYNGVNEYFFAVVYSPTYYNSNDSLPTTHAVIIDKDFNIVHDVNPNNKNVEKYPKSKELGFNGVIYVYIIEKVAELLNDNI